MIFTESSPGAGILAPMRDCALSHIAATKRL
jgi:hypothetical protein